MRPRWLLRVVLTGVAVLTLGLGTTTAASATPRHVPSGSYLALGDSVAFGYRPPEVTPISDYFDAANFSGYPDDVAAAYRLKLVNLSCPGETTASMINFRAPSNGCENSPTGGVAYRTTFPLHVSYAGSQLGRAVRYLRSHPATRLVTLDIGANDVFLCQATTADHCTGSDFLAVLAEVGRNTARIVGALRAADPHVPIVLLTYYATDYRDLAQVATVSALNATVALAAAPFRVRIADGFAAFWRAASGHNGDACAAGLLIALPAGGCNIHPSPTGHVVLARAISHALRLVPAISRRSVPTP